MNMVVKQAARYAVKSGFKQIGEYTSNNLPGVANTVSNPLVHRIGKAMVGSIAIGAATNYAANASAGMEEGDWTAGMDPVGGAIARAAGKFGRAVYHGAEGIVDAHHRKTGDAVAAVETVAAAAGGLAEGVVEAQHRKAGDAVASVTAAYAATKASMEAFSQAQVEQSQRDFPIVPAVGWVAGTDFFQEQIRPVVLQGKGVFGRMMHLAGQGVIEDVTLDTSQAKSVIDPVITGVGKTVMEAVIEDVESDTVLANGMTKAVAGAALLFGENFLGAQHQLDDRVSKPLAGELREMYHDLSTMSEAEQIRRIQLFLGGKGEDLDITAALNDFNAANKDLGTNALALQELSKIYERLGPEYKKYIDVYADKILARIDLSKLKVKPLTVASTTFKGSEATAKGLARGLSMVALFEAYRAIRPEQADEIVSRAAKAYVPVRQVLTDKYKEYKQRARKLSEEPRDEASSEEQVEVMKAMKKL